MSAPDRIWAFPKNDWLNAGASTHRITAAGAKDFEYTRSDLATAEVNALSAEVSRMRAALEDVAGIGFDAPMTFSGSDAEWERKRANIMQSIAKAALEQKP